MNAVRALRVVQSTPPRPNAGARPCAEALDDVASFVARFNVFPSEHCVPTLALYAHTHMVDRFYVTPRLILDSAEPGSGKTRVLEVAQFLVDAPEMTISAKPAALFRLVQAGPITILFDEVDTIFNPKTSGNGDLRAMLNAGYKRSATIPRCVGDVKAMQVKRFKVYAPDGCTAEKPCGHRYGAHCPTRHDGGVVTTEVKSRAGQRTVWYSDAAGASA